jgi:histidine kinase
MKPLRQLRWKLFISHLLIVIIAIAVFLPSVYFLAGNPALLNPAPGAATAQNPVAGRPRAERLIDAIDEAFLIAAFAALSAGVVVSLFVSRRVVEPVQELTQVSGRLARGYYGERMTIRSDDELSVLGGSLNQLAETLDKTEQRRLGLIADVAHELRTPLATIEGYMEGLLDDVIKPEPRIYAMVHHEATRLKWMIEEMALLSKAEAGTLRFSPRPVDIGLIVRTVAEQMQPQAQAQRQTLSVDIPAVLPKVNIDPDRIRQVLINLVTNGLQYTPPDGRVAIALAADEKYVTVSVSDTGVGIAAEHLPHIFERFYRVDKSRARTTGGAGIGLTIARHFVYAHGGEIWAACEGLGRGLTMRFTVPTLPIRGGAA